MQRFKNILFVHNVGQNDAALRRAIAIAEENRATLTLIKVSEQIMDADLASASDSMRDIRQVILEDYHELLEQLVQPYRGRAKIETKVLEGRHFLTIIHEVLRNGYDLVVKGADGDERLRHRLFSTTDMHLLRKCPCPVLLVKPDQGDKIERIVAALDLGDPGEEQGNHALNKQILEMAISLAYRQKAELHVVHAWKAIAEHVLSSARSGMPEEKVEAYVAEVKASHERRLSMLLQMAREWVGPKMFDAVNPQIHAIKGRAEDIIEQQVQSLSAEVLVMGTIGRTGIPGFFIGNTAETVLNCINCSVLAIKPAGFVSPVVLGDEKK